MKNKQIAHSSIRLCSRDDNITGLGLADGRGAPQVPRLQTALKLKFTLPHLEHFQSPSLAAVIKKIHFIIKMSQCSTIRPRIFVQNATIIDRPIFLKFQR